MKPVQRVAQGREAAAVRKLGQSQQYLDAQMARLEELQAYRDQYARDFEASAGGGLDALRIQDYRMFLNRLGEAIRQQEALIQQCIAHHEDSRKAWVESRSHSQAIEKVVDRYQVEERRQRDRKEQLEQDERAQRKPNK
jgi:flagellar FliJ protein